MLTYIVRRLLLMIPTLLGIMIINFLIVQLAPGGPIDRYLAELRGLGSGALESATGGNAGDVGFDAADLAAGDGDSVYRGAEGLDPAFVAQLREQFGYDLPLHERFLRMMGDYLTFDFGDSFFQGRPVVDLVIDTIPVSISLGLWTTLIIYAISIPLGIRKAVRDGSRFDVWTSGVIVVGYAVPNFLFAVLLIVLFAGGSYLSWFPLSDLVSSNWSELSWWEQILDYFWHITLPVTALVISGFATLTMLTKNSFIDEIGKVYVLTARAKGLSENRVLYGHVFRNAMLIVVAGFPAALISILFTGALLIEVVFSLDGLGFLGYRAVFDRDFPIIFGTLYVFSLMALVMGLIRDIVYMLIDPRIDFEARAV